MIVTRPAANFAFAIGALVFRPSITANGTTFPITCDLGLSPSAVLPAFTAVISLMGIAPIGRFAWTATSFRILWILQVNGFQCLRGPWSATLVIRWAKRSSGGIWSLLMMKVRPAFSFAVSCPPTTHEHQMKGDVTRREVGADCAAGPGAILSAKLPPRRCRRKRGPQIVTGDSGPAELKDNHRS
jgi:hypothetical protein